MYHTGALIRGSGFTVSWVFTVANHVRMNKKNRTVRRTEEQDTFDDFFFILQKHF